MNFPDDQLQELKLLCPGVAAAEEGGKTYLLLPKLKLPETASIAETDALLLPTPLDGYDSRIYFPQKIDGPKTLNWTVNGALILDRQWFAHSWRTRPNLRLTQMVAAHLTAFRK
jgi:hypothetical protein